MKNIHLAFLGLSTILMGISFLFALSVVLWPTALFRAVCVFVFAELLLYAGKYSWNWSEKEERTEVSTFEKVEEMDEHHLRALQKEMLSNSEEPMPTMPTEQMEHLVNYVKQQLH
ncbi:MAG: hypothetical protein ACRCWQ_14910 [Bacilli bacterium]